MYVVEDVGLHVLPLNALQSLRVTPGIKKKSLYIFLNVAVVVLTCCVFTPTIHVPYHTCSLPMLVITPRPPRQEGGKISKLFLCNLWKNRNERPTVGGVSIRSKNGAPSAWSMVE